jgi:hypothetical protein
VSEERVLAATEGRRRSWQGSSADWLHGRWHYLERGFGGDVVATLSRET